MYCTRSLAAEADTAAGPVFELVADVELVLACEADMQRRTRRVVEP